MALDAIEQLLVANHGFTVTPEGAVVSPSGQVRNVVDGKTTFTPYTPPTTEPTFAEQFAAQQAQAIADTNQVRQDEAIASGSDTYQSMAPDGTVTNVSVGTPANLQEQILSVGQPTFSSGSPTQALPAAPPPASTQTREDLVSALGEATESDTDTFTYSGDKTGKTVTFDDGSVLTQKGYSFQYEDADGNPIDLDLKPGLKQSVDSKNEALGVVVRGIKSDLTEDVYGEFGGEEGALVSEYLADEAAAAQRRAKSDERKDEAMFGTMDLNPKSDTYLQRTGGTMQDLNEQVQREADALGISTDAYYSLGMPLRGQMAISDIGELFGETNIVPSSDYGGLLGAYNPTNVSSGLGTLSSENAAEYGKAARDYLSKNYAPNYSPSLDTMDAMYYADVGPADTYSPSLDTMDAMYDADVGGTYTPPVSNTSDFEIFGDTGQDIYSIGGIDLGPGNPIGPGAGSNTGGGGPNVGGGGDTGGDAGGGDTGGGGIGGGVPVIGPGVIGGGTGGGDTGGGGIGGGVPVAGTKPDPSTYIVPSTANYGEDPRFANLAPTYNVSKAAMPVFNRFDPRLQPVQPIGLLAQGGIVSLAEGGAPMDQVAKDFFIRQIPRALTEKDGGGMARRLANIHDIHDLGIDEDTFLALKYYRGPGGMKHGGVAERGYSHEGIGSLSDTARNMFRPMVS